MPPNSGSGTQFSANLILSAALARIVSVRLNSIVTRKIETRIVLSYSCRFEFGGLEDSSLLFGSVPPPQGQIADEVDRREHQQPQQRSDEHGGEDVGGVAQSLGDEDRHAQARAAR